MNIRRVLLTFPHACRAFYCFVRQMLLLIWEAPAVFAFMKLLERTRLPDDHPWESGEVDDERGGKIWPRNIVYRSPGKMGATEESDAEIVCSVGRFLAAMTARSGVEPEIAHGPKRRMPHAVNFIHGAVHHNGAFVVLDDFEDLVSHLTDRAFRRDLLRFGRAECREITIVFRQRKYDPVDFAHAIGAVRNHLPWFSNGNGPTKRPVLWGNASPHPAVALINGAWMKDLWHLHRGRFDAVVRAPIDSREHFAESYFGRRKHFEFGDRLNAYFQYNDVRARGFRGQLFFTNRKRIEPKRIGEYREAGGYLKWTACHDVPPPSVRAPRARRKLEHTRVSVVIPALDEASNIVGAIDSARRALGAEEVIVVDGGSRDATVELARSRGARVLTDETGGRGGQCRAGAEAATGNVLVFLHADARVIGDARGAVDRALCDEGRRLAMFEQRTTVPGKRFRALDFMSSFDTIFTRFGDQGIIVTREFYDELGGMPRICLFEDVVFLRRARRRGTIHRIDAELAVSPRAFQQNGFVEQYAKCVRLFIRYFLGTPPARLHELYYEREAA